jgi:hypothetical protein
VTISRAIGSENGIIESIGDRTAALEIPASTIFNVKSFGAVGDGTTDDTAAIQAAINAAMAVYGTVIFPPTPAGQAWLVSSTLNVYNPALTGAQQTTVNLQFEGRFNAIRYTGASGTAVFASRGWKRSRISGAQIRVATGLTGVIAFDLDVGTFGSATYSSSAQLMFDRCDVHADVDGVTVVGWRLSHTSSSADMSFIDWRNCSVTGRAATAGSIGWRNEGGNTLNLVWLNCSASFCATAWTNVSGAGAATAQGGDSGFWYACGGTGNVIDFELKTAGIYTMTGGRFELGAQLLSVPNGGGSKVTSMITMVGVKAATYTPPSGRMFDLESSVNLTLIGCMFPTPTVTPTASFIYGRQASDGIGSINIRGCALGTGAPYIFWDLATGTWRKEVTSCVTTDSSGNAVAVVGDYRSLAASAAGVALDTGKYYFTASPTAQATGTTGSNVLRLLPWYVPAPVTIVRIGAEVTVIGDVGSKVRLGIYADSGVGYPGALVVDAGQILGDSATVQELTISTVLAPGLYWIGGAAQSVTTTQPTMRNVATSWVPPLLPQLGTTIPGSAAQTFGFLQNAVSGALGGTFTSTLTTSGTGIRVFVKTA